MNHLSVHQLGRSAGREAAHPLPREAQPSARAVFLRGGAGG